MLDELDSCAKLAKADIIPWEKGDARFNVLTALLIAAGKLDLELYWNLDRGELLLKNKYYSTNLGAGSSEAILNAALALDFIATSSQIKSLTQEEERQKAEQRERGRNMQTSEMSVEEAATLKKLVKRAKQINNSYCRKMARHSICGGNRHAACFSSVMHMSRTGNIFGPGRGMCGATCLICRMSCQCWKNLSLVMKSYIRHGAKSSSNRRNKNLLRNSADRSCREILLRNFPSQGNLASKTQNSPTNGGVFLD